jgi:hypothetical protein
MIAKVKRIETDPWLGVKKYPGIGPDKIPVGLDSRTGELTKVLTDEEQIKFENELGFERGTLSRNSPFWVEFFVPLEVDNTFDTEIPIHALFLKVLEKKKIVAKSLAELKTNAYAKYVIYNDVAEAKVANISRKSKKEAYGLFSQMSQAEMVKTLVAYGKKPYDMDPEVVENTIGDLIEQDADKFTTIVTDPNLEQRIFLNELVNYGVIITRSKQFIYDQTNMGELERAVEFITAKENSDLYISLQRQLQEAKKRSL